MSKIEIGKKAPSFKILNQNELVKTNKDYIGKWLVLYFYPKDNTPGCTKEAVDFTELKKKFAAKNAEIVGVSADSPSKHINFIKKQSLKIELLSDEEKSNLEKFGVWQLKKMAGREYMGIVKTTFLIDPDGKIAFIWPKVKVNGHVEAVLEKLIELQK
ncbi:MAG: peroxiredoxin [Deltaproteobacteria bacterium]|nr:peroxiredoxin [Deltaproteobacteria bacterium]